MNNPNNEQTVPAQPLQSPTPSTSPVQPSVQQLAPQQQASPAPSRGMPKLLIGIMFFFIIFVVGAGGYVLGTKKVSLTNPKAAVSSTVSQTSPSSISDLTVSWKTYTNTQNGYSIKYPGNEFVHLLCPNEELDLQIRSSSADASSDEVPLSTCGRDGRFDIETRTYDTVKDVRWLNLETDLDFNKSYLVKTESIVVAGVASKKYIISVKPDCLGQCSMMAGIQIHIPKNNKVYVLYLTKKDKLSTFLTMLQTFKFTN